MRYQSSFFLQRCGFKVVDQRYFGAAAEHLSACLALTTYTNLLRIVALEV